MISAGCRAVVVAPGAKCDGLIVRVLRVATTANLAETFGARPPPGPIWYIDQELGWGPKGTRKVTRQLPLCPEKCLQRLDDYDGNVTTTWDKCIWRPAHDYESKDSHVGKSYASNRPERRNRRVVRSD